MELPNLPGTEKERQEYGRLWLLEHALGQKIQTWSAQQRKQLDTRILNQLKRTPGRVLPIERRKNLSLAEYKRVYLGKGIPVVLQGAAKDWPAVGKWSPAFLSEHYGQDQIMLIDASPANLQNISRKPELTTLADVIASMDGDALKKYSRFNRILHEHPELQADLDLNWLLSRRNTLCSGRTFQVFIGGKGSKTHLHSASEHNLFVQVYGEKHWIIYPPGYDCVLTPPVTGTPYFHSEFNPEAPDFDAYPAMQYLDRYECTLQPGDILFNPPSWWHHVSNLTHSIGIGFRWFSADAFKLDVTQALLTLFATNPPIWTATRFRTDFARIFTHRFKD
ncbi:MAG: cupin-like domain-containing protein [Candidatus Sericytochromatia bacterium]|nr:cupin-like domain-containing protein [Candidatus Sericytochromatia bacterium]